MERWLLTLLLLFFASVADAQVTYYVNGDASGASDSNDGLSMTFTSGTNGPWLTVQRATGQANVPGSPPNAVPAAGDTVWIRQNAANYVYAVTPASSTSPCFSPTNSGNAVSGYIKYKGWPGERPVLDCNQYGTPGGSPDTNEQGSPVFGGLSDSYIWWENLATAGGWKDVKVTSSDHIVLRNINITKTPRTGSTGTGNYYCFFMTSSSVVEITESTCRDSYTAASPGDQNAGCFVQFDTDHLNVHNNDCLNVGDGLNDKRAGRSNRWAFNYVLNNPGGKGAQISVFTSAACSSWNCSVEDITFEGNVFRGDGSSAGSALVGVSFLNTPDGSMPSQVLNSWIVKNNSFFHHDRPFRVTYPTTGIVFLNNVVTYNGTGTPTFAQQHGYGNAIVGQQPPADMISENNCYRRDSGTPLQFDPTETGGGGVETFATSGTSGWRSTSSSSHPAGVAYDNRVDANTNQSIEISGGTQVFVTESSTDGPVTDLQLHASSACRTIGVTNTNGTGAVIQAGAFFSAIVPGVGGEAASTGTTLGGGVSIGRGAGIR